MTYDKTGVMLMAYGGPGSIEEVPAFLDAIVGKGRLSSEQVEEITDRYRAIGGGSPLLSVTLRQAEALRKRLAESGRPWPVAVGMRYTRPTIAHALEELVGEGCSRILGCPLAPHASPASTEAYRKALGGAAEGVDAPLDVTLVEGWHASPRFLEAWAESVKEAWETVPKKERGKALLVFTVHNLPVSLAEGSPYEAQVGESIEGVMSLVGQVPWRLAWQSQGIRGGEWLTPDIPETLDAAASEGFETVVFVPIGFVSDHVETFYDLDIDARRLAEKRELAFHRAASMNDRPAFIEALAEAVLAAAEAS